MSAPLENDPLAGHPHRAPHLARGGANWVAAHRVDAHRMHARRGPRLRAQPPKLLVALALCMAALSLGVAAASANQARTTATILPALTPDRLGAEGALQLTIHYATGESGVPAPVRRSILRFPLGLGVEIPHLRSCSLARLRTRGPSACPKQSLLGHGNVLAEAQAGSQIISENIALSLFVGPFHNLQPTFEILGRGYSPFDESIVLTGTVLPDNPPFGEDLVLSVPPIPTLPLEPDASIVSMSLTVGSSNPSHPITVNTVVVPPSCPAGGFPFAAEFTYADGSVGNALASAPCP